MSGTRIVKLRIFKDARGALFEPLEPELLAGWNNVHAVVSEPGTVRGNHRHLRGTEVTTVYGPTLVRYREGGETRDAEVPEGECWRFHFPPGTAHAFRNIGARANLLVSFNSELHDAEHPDVERVELM